MLLETVDDKDALVVDTAWSMSRFMQFLVNRVCVDVASSVGTRPSNDVDRGQGPAVGAIAWLRKKGAGLQLVLVAWLRRNCCKAGASLQLVLAVASTSHGICQEGVLRRPKVISEDFLKLILSRAVWMRRSAVIGWLAVLGLQLWLVGFHIVCFGWW